MSKRKKPRTAKAPTLAEAKAPSTLKLDLGCGQNPKEGFEGVDLCGDKAKHKVDLFKFPWPFADNSVDEIHASHFLEHVPAREVEERDVLIPPSALPPLDRLMAPNLAIVKEREDFLNRFLGQDMLFAFMDECYRILKPDCWMHVVVPSGRSNRAFWDPTHRRFFMQETFLYFYREWRKQNGLDHYRVKCNFAADITHSMPQEEGMKSAEAQSARFHTLWNVTVDWHAKLKKLP